MSPLRVSNHAVRKYVERVKPTLEGRPDVARQELERLVLAGQVVKDTPAWLPERRDGERHADLWVTVDECGIAMPVLGNIVLTVLCHRHISDTTRTKRNDARKARKAKVRVQRRYASTRPMTG